MNPEYTKGQWEIWHTSNMGDIIQAGDQINRREIAHVTQGNPWKESSILESKANARLISAAPDMFNILHGLVNDPEHFSLLPPHYKQAISRAIVKAEGVNDTK